MCVCARARGSGIGGLCGEGIVCAEMCSKEGGLPPACELRGGMDDKPRLFVKQRWHRPVLQTSSPVMLAAPEPTTYGKTGGADAACRSSSEALLLTHVLTTE